MISPRNFPLLFNSSCLSAATKCFDSDLNKKLQGISLRLIQILPFQLSACFTRWILRQLIRRNGALCALSKAFISYSRAAGSKRPMQNPKCHQTAPGSPWVPHSTRDPSTAHYLASSHQNRTSRSQELCWFIRKK